ncbi:hypothetical protein COTS27_00345 [Spirochaetota bacterium]|nr:hypothetical protein COTS27_00345 [Spirochaetota bacterium]
MKKKENEDVLKKNEHLERQKNSTRSTRPESIIQKHSMYRDNIETSLKPILRANGIGEDKPKRIDKDNN